MPLKPRQPFRTDLSINDIRASAWNATQGSVDSYEYLQRENRRLAKLANRRLRDLEKAGYDMFAYDRAFTYLRNHDRTRFSLQLAPSTDWRGMVTQLSELITFVNAKTSTVAGARTTLNAKIDKISEYTGTIYTDQQRIQLGRLLGSDSVSSLLREVKGGSEEVLDFLEEAAFKDSNANDNIDAIKSIIDKHLAGYNPWGDNSDYLSYDEMMDELRTLYERS